jgi:hypothetical protein
MKSEIYYLLLSVFLTITSCNVVNPAEEIPTYIQIDSVHVLPTLPGLHGSVTHKITDVWVYLNRELLGAYELPAKVPILLKELGQLQFVAGIYENGLSGTRARYPFYTVDTLSVSPNPTNSLHYVPNFMYQTANSSVDYFLEDFEQGNSFTFYNGDTSFAKTNVPSDVFEGTWSCKMTLQDTFPTGESISVNPFNLPSERISYMELNYKSDIPFVIKLQITQFGAVSTIDLIGVNASSNWNKIYLNLGSYGASFQNSSFKTIFQAGLPGGISSGSVWIDNYKIIHFKQ